MGVHVVLFTLRPDPQRSKGLTSVTEILSVLIGTTGGWASSTGCNVVPTGSVPEVLVPQATTQVAHEPVISFHLFRPFVWLRYTAQDTPQKQQQQQQQQQQNNNNNKTA